MARIRIYSPEFPFPPTGGSPQVVFDQVRALSDAGHNVELVVWKGNAEQSENGRLSAHTEEFPHRVSVRSLDHHLPTNKAIERPFRVLKSLLSGTASSEECYYPQNLKNVALQGEAVDWTIFHYSFAHAWLNSPSGIRGGRVVMFHNLESELSEQRARRSKGLIQRLIHLRNASLLRAHELQVLSRVEEAWFVSRQDFKTLVDRAPSSLARKCRFVPPGYSEAFHRRRKIEFEKSHSVRGRRNRTLGLIGALDFGPNLESAVWIVERFAPALKASGFDGEVVIAGKNPPNELMRAAAKYPFVRIAGFVNDIEAYWSGLSFSLVPHIGGSGVRMKLLESIASGVPVIANRAAVERVHSALLMEAGVLVSDNPSQWAEWVMKSEPYETRLRLQDRSLPDALNGDRTYAEIAKELSLDDSKS